MTETRKLVKAKPKALEYLPGWALCCPAQKSRYVSQRELILEVDLGTQRHSRATCHDCGERKGSLCFVDAISPYHSPIAIELLDLCEGDYAEAVEAQN